MESVQALRTRARKQRAARKPHLSEIKPGSVIENMAQTRRLAETALVGAGVSATLPPPSSASLTLEDDKPTNTGSGSQVREELFFCMFIVIFNCLFLIN